MRSFLIMPFPLYGRVLDKISVTIDGVISRTSTFNAIRCHHNFLIRSTYNSFQYIIRRSNRLVYTQLNRYCSNRIDEPEFPDLTSFPMVYWPNFFKFTKNKFLSRFIRHFYASDFSLDEFIRGSKHAVGVVSDCISRSDWNGISEVVTPDVIAEVRLNLLKFSLKQISDIRINPEDIYLCFPYEVGIILPDENDSRKRFVEVTMCYHVLSGYKILSRSSNFSLQMLDFDKQLYVLNYRFCRDYSQGVKESYWIINALNHSKPLVSDT